MRFVFLIALLGLGCRRPPEAPTDLDDLCGYLYAYHAEEDPEAVQDGLVNLDLWLQEPANIEATLEGYSVTNLSQETVDALDDRERDLDGLRGAAVAYESVHGVDAVAEALLVADQTEVFPETYTTFDRDFRDDLDCFVARECDWLEVVNFTESGYALGIDVATEATAQFRWARVGEDGDFALLTRSWMNAEAEVSVDWLKVEEQYYLSVVLPDAGGGSVRLQATWVIAEIVGADVPEGTALQLVINSMQGAGEEIDAWIDAQ